MSNEVFNTWPRSMLPKPFWVENPFDLNFFWQNPNPKVNMFGHI